MKQRGMIILTVYVGSGHINCRSGVWSYHIL